MGIRKNDVQLLEDHLGIPYFNAVSYTHLTLPTIDDV